MKYTPLSLFFVFLAAVMFAPSNADARVGFGFNRSFQLQNRMMMRQSFRPWIKVVRPKGADRRLAANGRHTYEYHVQRGWVSRIEIRSGLKVIRTIHVPRSRRGRGTFTLTKSDLAQIKRGFKLWAYQGQGGFQSVHGPSIGYTLK